MRFDGDGVRFAKNDDDCSSPEVAAARERLFKWSLGWRRGELVPVRRKPEVGELWEEGLSQPISSISRPVLARIVDEMFVRRWHPGMQETRDDLIQKAFRKRRAMDEPARRRSAEMAVGRVHKMYFDHPWESQVFQPEAHSDPRGVTRSTRSGTSTSPSGYAAASHHRIARENATIISPPGQSGFTRAGTGRDWADGGQIRCTLHGEGSPVLRPSRRDGDSTARTRASPGDGRRLGDRRPRCGVTRVSSGRRSAWRSFCGAFDISPISLVISSTCLPWSGKPAGIIVLTGRVLLTMVSPAVHAGVY